MHLCHVSQSAAVMAMGWLIGHVGPEASADASQTLQANSVNNVPQGTMGTHTAPVCIYPTTLLIGPMCTVYPLHFYIAYIFILATI